MFVGEKMHTPESAIPLSEDVLHLIQEVLDQSVHKTSETLFRQFYGNFEFEDLKAFTPHRLSQAFLNLWELLQNRQPAQAKYKLYTWKPAKREHEAERLIIDLINPNMPFLVDSFIGLLQRHGLKANMLLHPVICVKRDENHQLTEILPTLRPVSEGESHESIIHCEIKDILNRHQIEALEAEIPLVLKDIGTATQDWPAMRHQALSYLNALSAHSSLPQLRETLDFIKWIENGHFTFLGYAEYALTGSSIGMPMEESLLGIMKRSDLNHLKVIFEGFDQGEEAREYIFEPRILFVNKASQVSMVHRAAQMDTIGLRVFDENNQVIGLKLFVGLFTSEAYDSSARDIPLLSQKVEQIVQRAGLDKGWHNGKALIHILDSLPRDELFQATEEELAEIGLSVLEVQARQRLAMFRRKDQFNRFYSFLIYIPRDRFDYALCGKIRDLIAHVTCSEVVMLKAQFSSFSLALVHYRITLTPQSNQDFDSIDLENQLIEAARSWGDSLKIILEEKLNEWDSFSLLKKYGNAFSKTYQEVFEAQDAFEDIHFFEKMLPHKTREVCVYRPVGYPTTKLKVKIYNPEQALPLSDVFQTLENLDLRVLKEIPYEIKPIGGVPSLWVHDFDLESRGHCSIDLESAQQNLSETLYKVWNGQTEDDPFNRLVVRAGFTWRESFLFLGFCRYLRQIETHFSEQYMALTLIQNPVITRMIKDLFKARFHPESHASAEAESLSKAIEDALAVIENPDEDRILRSFFNVVASMLRTNFYQVKKDEHPKSYISFKLDCAKVNDLPLPRPLYEIFVFSPEMEAIHLRGGKVARGGIRWSDRMEDYRKEILGLMKAQMVKNTVIVPVGSKGGFIVKKPKQGASREEQINQGIKCYKIMMQGLLDITDNLVGGAVVPPKNVVRYDDDDPYLVVAADKGTAAFSDYANEVSSRYAFWLQDAFASGGSQGYDHKKMGITARGAWESVRQHFRYLDINVDKDPISVVGIGDMSGDVFGNGMLLSEHIGLVAAFNHMHIFMDPTPVPEVSFKERKRLFELPKSTWMDYNPDLISEGGGVFNRQAKSISLTPQMCRLLGIDRSELPPHLLIQAILRMKVDLLWFGGIGTYIKSKFESHADVGDRVNDPVRINGSDVRARVIAEGANLGMTQLGRIEFARAGGLLNTDAIDNSAGVDCSDHEVNIKILMNQLVVDGQITLEERNKTLEKMTPNISSLVLRDNQLQNLSIMSTQARGVITLDQKINLMHVLEKSGLLNREIEFLPDDATLTEYQKNNTGLTRPEIAVLLAYAKIKAYQDILPSSLLDHPYFEGRLVSYFPSILQQHYRYAILKHPLRREIIATLAINTVINRMGATFITEMEEKSSSTIEDVLQAYFIVQEIFGLRDLWYRAENLHEHIGFKNQLSVMKTLWRLIRRATLWMLRSNPEKLDLTTTTEVFNKGVKELETHLQACLDHESLENLKKGIAGYTELGLNLDFSERLAQLSLVASFPDIILIARDSGYSISEAAKVYFFVGGNFGLNFLRQVVDGLKSTNSWQRLALMALMEDLYNYQEEITIRILAYGKAHRAEVNQEADLLTKSWISDHRKACFQVEHMLQELKTTANIGLAHLMVIVREIRGLSES